MRTSTKAIIVGLVLTVLCHQRVSGQAENREIKDLLDRAIKAHGGEANLTKYPATTFKMKGKFYGMGEGIDYSGDMAVYLPAKFRFNFNFDIMGVKIKVAQVINGDQGWNKLNDDTKKMDKDELAEAKEALYDLRVSRLAPLKGKAFKLAPLGDVKIKDRPAIGLRVSHKGFRDINLFFDKEKHYLLKSESVVKDFMMGGQEFNQETFYQDYKTIDGAAVALKLVIHRNGKLFLDGEISDVQVSEKLDDGLFGKP